MNFNNFTNDSLKILIYEIYFSYLADLKFAITTL